MSSRIVPDPAVMKGKPMVAGTRITVESIRERLPAGETFDPVIEANPRLAREPVQAALAFAAEALRAGRRLPDSERGSLKLVCDEGVDDCFDSPPYPKLARPAA